MALRRNGSLRRALSMTSLIDVIFLLLLFFMLTSTFTRFADVPLVAATRGGPATPGAEAPLFLRLSAEGLSLNGVTLSPDVLRDELRSRAEAGPRQLIVALASDEVTAQDLVDVLIAARVAPNLSVQVVR